MDVSQYFLMASFVHDEENLILTEKKSLLLVSVGQKYHEDDKLSATVDLINRSRFASCTIAVADTLQRHNYHSCDAKQAYASALAAGDAWLIRNADILAALIPRASILRWNEACTDPGYSAFRNDIERTYANDPAYRAAVDKTIDRFIERANKRDEHADTSQLFADCLTYLMEECPIIMPLWASQAYDYIIYPQLMTTAMRATRERFVAPKYPDKARWLSLKFKKISTPPCIRNIF